MHVRDLNFVLRSEIFIHLDEQLRVSHLILGIEPVYSTWQALNQALLVDSPFLSYIDVRHANFLPPNLTVGEAHDLNPRYICSDELALVRDKSAERVSQNRQVHVPVEPEAPVQPEAPVEPEAPIQEAKEIVTESISSSGTESDQGHDMVTRRTMTISLFVPDAQPTPQQQEPQGKDPTPPPPPFSGRSRKRQLTTE